MSAISRAMEIAYNKRMLLLNLFGGPGTGKSTLAHYIFAKTLESTWANIRKLLVEQGVKLPEETWVL